MYNTRMFRYAFLLSFAFLSSVAGAAHAAAPAIDIDTAAQLYQQAAIREQVRASWVRLSKWGNVTNSSRRHGAA